MLSRSHCMLWYAYHPHVSIGISVHSKPSLACPPLLICFLISRKAMPRQRQRQRRSSALQPCGYNYSATRTCITCWMHPKFQTLNMTGCLPNCRLLKRHSPSCEPPIHPHNASLARSWTVLYRFIMLCRCFPFALKPIMEKAARTCLISVFEKNWGWNRMSHLCNTRLN